MSEDKFDEAAYDAYWRGLGAIIPGDFVPDELQSAYDAFMEGWWANHCGGAGPLDIELSLKAWVDSDTRKKHVKI